MYEHFYGLKEKPFSLMPDPGFLYLGSGHEHALTMLEYALANRASFSVITGLMGTGKTTLLRRLLDQLDDGVRVGLVTNTAGDYVEVLRRILLAFDAEDTSGTRPELERRFVDLLHDAAARGTDCLLIIDEAQNLSTDDLEGLRLLSNTDSGEGSVLQIILAGQQGLRETLNQPELAQFAQRIAVDYHLGPLEPHETRAYIRHRVAIAGGSPGLFTDDACQAVYRYTGGVPRLINLICDMALVYGYGERSAVIHADLIKTVMHERHEHEMLPIFRRPEADEERDGTEAPRTAGEPDGPATPAEHAGRSAPERPGAPVGRAPTSSAADEATLGGERGAGARQRNREHADHAPEATLAYGNVVALARTDARATEHAPQSGPDVADEPHQEQEHVHTESERKEHTMPSAGPSAPSTRPARTLTAFLVGALITAAMLAGWILTRPSDIVGLLPQERATATSTQPGPSGPAPGSSAADSADGGSSTATAAQGVATDRVEALREQVQALRAQLETLKRERDAARDKAAKLERELDEAREALASQRTLRQQAEKRAERLATEQRETDEALGEARARAREAEARAARALERERQARAEAERAWRNLEALSQRRVRENAARAKAPKPAGQSSGARDTSSAAAPSRGRGSADSRGVTESEASKIEFKTDPCKGASAMFLSTCKE